MERLVSIIPYRRIGGIHLEVIRSARGLLERGIDSVVVVPCGSTVGPFLDEGIQVVQWRLARPGRFGVAGHVVESLVQAPSLGRMLLRLEAGAVRSFGLQNPQAVLAARWAGLPSIVTVSSDFLKGMVARVLLHAMNGSSTAYLATGTGLASSVGQVVGMDRVVEYLPPIGPVDRSVDDAFRKGYDGVLLASVSKFTRQKNLPLLVDVVAELRSAGMPTSCIILGAIEQADQLELVRNRAAKAGLAVLYGAPADGVVRDGDLHILGRSARVAATLRASDVSIVTSEFEGMPAAVLESLACNTPVVSTPVGSIPDLARRDTRVSVVGFDSKALAEQVQKMFAMGKQPGALPASNDLEDAIVLAMRKVGSIVGG